MNLLRVYRGYGGIGRRARFRCEFSQESESSSLSIPTTLYFFLRRCAWSNASIFFAHCSVHLIFSFLGCRKNESDTSVSVRYAPYVFVCHFHFSDPVRIMGVEMCRQLIQIGAAISAVPVRTDLIHVLHNHHSISRVWVGDNQRNPMKQLRRLHSRLAKFRVDHRVNGTVAVTVQIVPVRTVHQLVRFGQVRHHLYLSAIENLPLVVRKILRRIFRNHHNPIMVRSGFVFSPWADRRRLVAI